ncbi:MULTISPECIES: TetR family transcriptional regulator [unclassified Alteromonas]|nr:MULTISPECIES: TetR family transcriptional regulator [unclassified Alteromonas]AYA62885.1 TetR family transcriptional regulator [Alteromonas sp. RKMC-009]MDO6475497.1 TetR family transcriptional regulator [Alteromonas sp. 1_MG-2023]MEC7689220.1 TetR family transcriptional regulator [Pseudomonadota bacterium]
MRRTKEDAELTKQTILKAAVDVFTERGVAKASLEEIARKADVTRGAVYWHFKNKMEIFDALHENLHTPFIERIMEGLEAEHPNPVGQLQELCTNIFLDLDQDEQLRKTLTLFMLKCDYSGDLKCSQEKHTTAKYDKIQAFSAYYKRAIKLGQLSADITPEDYTLAMNCFMRGILSEYLEAPEAFDITTKAPILMKIYFGGLRTDNV